MGVVFSSTGNSPAGNQVKCLHSTDAYAQEEKETKSKHGSQSDRITES